MTVEQSDAYEADLMYAKQVIPKDATIYKEEITDGGAVIELAMNDTSDLEFLFKSFDQESNRMCGVMMVHDCRIIKYEEVATCDTTVNDAEETEP